MTTSTKTQLFLLMLTIGFLTGPQVIALVNKLDVDKPLSGNINGKIASPYGVGEEVSVPLKTSTTTNPYSSLELSAKSIYVWDINAHRVLFSKNERAVLPLASVTKMMMALVAVEILPSDTQVSIAPVDLLEEGNTGLLAGEKWKLEDLLKFTLVASSNDGASAIASVAGARILGASSSDPFSDKKLFIRKMNEKAANIGLTQTTFSSVSGLDLNSVTSGAYGTSRDMAFLFEYILHKHPELFTPTAYSKLDVESNSNIVHHVANTNAGVSAVTGIIGSKTGYTDLAGGNLVVVVDIGMNHPVVIAVLGSTREGRFTDVEKLIDATLKEIAGFPSTAEVSAGGISNSNI